MCKYEISIVEKQILRKLYSIQPEISVTALCMLVYDKVCRLFEGWIKGILILFLKDRIV